MDRVLSFASFRGDSEGYFEHNFQSFHLALAENLRLPRIGALSLPWHSRPLHVNPVSASSSRESNIQNITISSYIILLQSNTLHECLLRQPFEIFPWSPSYSRQSTAGAIRKAESEADKRISTNQHSLHPLWPHTGPQFPTRALKSPVQKKETLI